MSAARSLAALAFAVLTLAGCSSTPPEPVRPAAPVTADVQRPVEAPPMPDLAEDVLFRAAYDQYLAAIEAAEAESVTMTAEECEAIAMRTDLSNAELRPRLRDLGCEAQADGLLVGAAGPAVDEQLPDGTPAYLCEGDPYASPWCSEGMTNEQYDEYYGGYEMSEEELYYEGLCGGGDGPEDVCGPTDPPSSGEIQYEHFCDPESDGYTPEYC